MSAWDEFADITSNEDETIQNEDLLQFDFMPFFVDSTELASICTEDLLTRVMSGAQLVACGKYVYGTRRRCWMGQKSVEPQVVLFHKRSRGHTQEI